MISKTLTYAALAMLAALPVEAQQKEEAKAGKYHSVPLIRTDRSGHYLAPVKVGNRDFRFLVDSGAGMELVLAQGTAKKLGKQLNDGGKAGAAGGSVAMQKTRVGRFSIGDAPRVAKGVQTYVIALHHAALELDGEKVIPDGLIGARLLNQWNVVVDTAKTALLVPDEGLSEGAFADRFEDDKAVKIPFERGMHGMPFVDLIIDGESYSFLIDTGAGTGTIEPGVAEKLGLEVIKENSSFGGAGDKRVNNAKVVMAKDAVLGGKARFPKIYFHTHTMDGTLKAPKGKNLGGILGGKVLASGGAFVDFGSQQIIIPKRIVLKRGAKAN
ncbi:Aspartyl protease [Rubritalea squalenifaciens DSM 18772]|uniref:Aspartyl protease n=1 Tax=Rubritalea squalenifaciens DSM 18772 TaxID=1123071 RepID=A0A1M6KWS4_9BACT|nr:aspartyl protease family protein [Rubritalea squalenifaciens]SHJ63405.1 Aspartyl protease [Rubritalea squalenifaciens DSM 18772]